MHFVIEFIQDFDEQAFDILIISRRSNALLSNDGLEGTDLHLQRTVFNLRGVVRDVFNIYLSPIVCSSTRCTLNSAMTPEEILLLAGVGEALHYNVTSITTAAIFWGEYDNIYMLA
jgi:hypothetical protein